jgi:heat shock protein HtpX
MPLTFYDIERQKNWRIVIFFIVLLLIYFVVILSLSATFSHWFSFSKLSHRGFLPDVKYLLVIMAIAVISSIIHFYFSAYNAVAYVKSNLNAIPPDPSDEIHKQLINITEEIQVAAGLKKKIECVVIPTLSTNALSAVDLQGNALIAITEGLLSRTSRAQLEAVMAHEAYHILSGDCVESTVAASLFGIPSSIIEKTSSTLRGRLFMNPAFLLAWLMIKLGNLLNLFISREREYRADAGAVRITRNPIALAETLNIISRKWKGSGFIGNGLEMLCIASPANKPVDESEGVFADMLSTHPPIRKRINILLNMAHSNISELESKVKTAAQRSSSKPSEKLFYALDNNYQWQGPFTAKELAELSWFSTLTWLSEDGKKTIKATDVQLLSDIFEKRIAMEEGSKTDYLCPLCQHSLVAKKYEKTEIYQCSFCGGALVDDVKIPRIIVRQDKEIPERIRCMAQTTLKENQVKQVLKNNFGKKSSQFINCPKCKSRMMRSFYSYGYLIELDKCAICNMTWFDRDELEMLQCMIDEQMLTKQI